MTPREPDYAKATPLGCRALELVVREYEAGVREIPAHSNRGPRIDLYLRGYGAQPKQQTGYIHLPEKPSEVVSPVDGMTGSKWCAALQKYVVDEACVERTGHRFRFPTDRMSAYKWWRGALKLGTWTTTPCAGHIAVHLGAHPHVGIVATLLPNGIVCTLEGNEGDTIQWMETPNVRRSRDYWTGYVILLLESDPRFISEGT